MSNPRKILCPHCRLVLPHDETAAGSSRECLFCGKQFIMPRGNSVSPGSEAAGRPRPVPQSSFFVPPPGPETNDNPPRSQGGGPVHPLPSLPLYPALEEPQETRDANRRPRRDGEEGAISDQLFPADLQQRRQEARQWKTVAGGLSMIQTGYLLFLFSLFAFWCVSSSMMMPGMERYYSSHPHSILPLLGCATMAAFLVGLVLVFAGQGMTCSAPLPPTRNSALGSLVLLVLSALMVFFLLFLANRVGGGMMYSQNLFFLPLLIIAVLLIGSHLLFVHFLQEVGGHFRGKSVHRHASFYQLFFVIYLGMSVAALFFSMDHRPWEQRPGGTTWVSREMINLAVIFWGCLGLFLIVVFISLMQQVRSLLRERLSHRSLRRVD